MKDYIVIVPLYSKILVKNVESAYEAVKCAEDKASLNIRYTNIDESEDIEVFEAACGETNFHLISQP